MLQFLAQDGIEVYAGSTGLICFKSLGDITGDGEKTVCLTIGQFRSVIKAADKLIENANEEKRNYQEYLEACEKDD
jgi:hypothetical protein